MKKWSFYGLVVVISWDGPRVSLLSIFLLNVVHLIKVDANCSLSQFDDLLRQVSQSKKGFWTVWVWKVYVSEVAKAIHVVILSVRTASRVFLTIVILKWSIHLMLKCDELLSLGMSSLFIPALTLQIHAQPAYLSTNSWYSALWKSSIAIKLNLHLVSD